jgi:hypothetical protein
MIALILLLAGLIVFLGMMLCKRAYFARAIDFLYAIAGVEAPTLRRWPVIPTPPAPTENSSEDDSLPPRVDLIPSAPPLDPIPEGEELDDDALEEVIYGEVTYDVSDDDPIPPSPLPIVPPSITVS